MDMSPYLYGAVRDHYRRGDLDAVRRVLSTASRDDLDRLNIRLIAELSAADPRSAEELEFEALRLDAEDADD